MSSSHKYAPVEQPGVELQAAGSMKKADFFTSEAMTLILGGGGIIVFLGLYGFQQERLMSYPYDGELFQDTVFLVLNNRLMAVTFACFMIKRTGETWVNGPQLWKYFAISVSNVIATTCQYEALKYVSFPVQMLGKSAKIVPVMVWGMAISGKSYSMQDWMISFGVTGGCMMFLLAGEISSSRAAQGDSVYGLVLLLGYLGADGFTSMFQEKLFGDYKTSKYNQMLYINGCSALMSIVWLLPTGQLTNAIAFSGRHPSFLVDACVLSFSATSGQYCIYTVIKQFGAVVFAACMNVRQVTNITISLLYYGHTISIGQFMGLMLVFAFLFYKVKLAKGKEESKKANAAQARADALEEGDDDGTELPTVVGK